jgi:hypothetical protein
LDLIIPFLEQVREDVESARARLRVVKGHGNNEFRGGWIMSDGYPES